MTAKWDAFTGRPLTEVRTGMCRNYRCTDIVAAAWMEIFFSALALLLHLSFEE